MTSEPTNDCSSGKFKRLNYFHGMLLTEQDFQEEQDYFREKMKLHNRLHGYGVVWGLEITSRCIKIEGKSVHKIFIEPGFALDCEGNEITVCHSHQVAIDEKIDQLIDSCETISPCTKLLIAIKYCECKSKPQPQYASECGDEDQQVQFSRICEGFSVQVLLEDEVPDCCKNKKQDDCCQKHKQDCPGLAACCEEDHVIILGCISLVTQKDKKDCDEDLKELVEKLKTNLESELKLCDEKQTTAEEKKDCKAAIIDKWNNYETELIKTWLGLDCEKNEIAKLLSENCKANLETKLVECEQKPELEKNQCRTDAIASWAECITDLIKTQLKLDCEKNKLETLIEKRDFSDKYIDLCCKPPRIFKPCLTHQEKWNQQKQRLLDEARKAKGSIDFCGVIGKSVCDAENYLTELGLSATYETKRINHYNYDDLRGVIENSDCYAEKGQVITLITDQQQQCVVFAYVGVVDLGEPVHE